ncbi:hypothetical protein DV736_g343, partial [Chaetothyriales sp. CBS 134916]
MLFSSHAFQASVLLLTSAVLGQYSLQDDYTTSSFGSMFDFFTDDDPTNGYVNYVSQSQAESQGLFATKNNAVYIGVDSTNVASGRGRNSVRISSNNVYTHGLFILDLEHMPGGECGTWPAFWILGPDWPNWGEVDIIENVNSATVNRMSAHTGSSCSITKMGNFTGSVLTTNCDSNAAGQSPNAGCSFTNTLTQTFGAGFNAIGGGVYATEWTSQAISIWFFPRLLIPSDILNGSPDPSGWGEPLAQFTGDGCDIDDHFKNHQIVFDVSMCGDWAGSVWSQDAICSVLASTCENYVQNNPGAFVDTYWLINSLKVYQANNQQVPSSTTTEAAALSPASAAPPAGALSSSKKESRGLSFEIFLIGLVFAAAAVMAHHTYEGWKGSHGAEAAGTGASAPAQSFSHNFTGDPLTGKGWWGPQTSAMNFCEEDHVVTFAIAEFINTLSNLAYVYFAFATWPKEAKLPPVTNVSLFLLGLSSGVYHATLKHYNQIWDESGMYLAVASMDWCLYSYPGAIFSGKAAKPIYTIVLWGACAAVVVMNFMATGADFGLHTVLFIALLTGLWPRCMWLIGERSRMEKQGLLAPDAIPVATIRKRCRIGGACFLLGFGVWLVDCIFCYELRAFRHRVGLPLAWLLECHGWWHVLTAVGAGVFVDLTNLFCSPIHGNVTSPGKQGQKTGINGDINTTSKRD